MQQLVTTQTVNLSSAPGSPLKGDTYYDTQLGAMRVYNGLAWGSLQRIMLSTNEFRLSLDPADPVPQTDQTAKTAIYLVPYTGNQISLYDGSTWSHVQTEAIGVLISDFGVTANQNYDIFVSAFRITPSSTDTGTDVLTIPSTSNLFSGASVVPNATGGGLTAGTTYWWRYLSATTGTLHTTLAGALANTNKVDITASITAELFIVSLGFGSTWTSDTVRNSAVTRQNGLYVITSRKWLGTMRGSATNQCEDSETKRFLYNYYNRVPRKLKKVETTASWTYNSTTWRELNGATNRVSWIDGSGEIPVDLQAQAMFGISTAGTHYIVGIGYDSTTTSDAELGAQCGGLASLQAVASARLLRANPFGYHYAAAVERCGSAGGNVTIYSNDTRYRTGILGTIFS